MKLPERVDSSTGHERDHAALKAEYDSRHIDAPLPTLGSRFGPDHLEIHRLLHEDVNALAEEGLPTKLEAWTGGHTAAHNVLHAAYNARLGEVNG